MGCGPSGTNYKNGTLRLMTTKHMYTKDQLDNLNTYFRKCVTNVETSPDIIAIESTVERLVQRLVARVGNLDRRFSSMFLVSLNERRRIKQLKFEYLLRIDALSTPVIISDEESAVNVEEDSSMPGFIRLKIRATVAENWAEFLGSGGRIRRDLIKAKVANLLAVATRQVASGVKNDHEDRMCFLPGQVVDAEVLDKILKQPDHCRIFYGTTSSETENPEFRENRVAIVEDASGILLRIGLDGTKSQDVEVRLLIGAAVSTWSTTADYPRRVPLHHCDTLLHYTTAQTGMFATSVGPYPGARCEDRATLWRIRVPAAEKVMSEHYSDESIPSLTDSVLQEILDQLQGRKPLDLDMKRKESLKIVSRHILRTIHWWSLERAGPDPLRSWAPDTLSRHILLCLDELVRALKCQNLRCYFHPRCNVMLQCAKGAILHQEDSYASDSKIVEEYLSLLQMKSASLFVGEANTNDLMETELISRWQRVLNSVPKGTMGGHFGYSLNQLQYLGLIIQQVLKAKEATLQESVDNSPFLNFFASSPHSLEPIDNLVYLLTLVLKQSRDQMYTVMDHRKKKCTRRRLLKERNRNNASAYFERSVDILVETVRRDRETAYMDLENPVIMAETLLKWLYFGMEQDKKTLGPIIKPYLGNLFNSSHENGWHVESWKKRQENCNLEMRSLAMFCKLVTTGEISPANGIVESLSKGWHWSENIARMIERFNCGLKLVFITTDGVMKFCLKFDEDKGPSAFSTWSKGRNISNALKKATISKINLIAIDETLPNLKNGTKESNHDFAGHVDLRNFSPLTYIVSINRRRGRQRGPGGLISALVTLNKFRILQEVAQVLPQNEKTEMLDMIQKVSREASRTRRISCPDIFPNAPKETYTPRSESNICDSPRQYSPGTRQRCIIAEHQRQLHREMLEMHDTLTRGLRTRCQLPVWDSSSIGSWKSSVRSIRQCKSKKGKSPLRDIVSVSKTFEKRKSGEMISREESPKWNTIDSRCSDYRDIDKLPS